MVTDDSWAWSPICVQHWGYNERLNAVLGVGAGGVSPSRNRGSGILPPEIFWKFYMPNGAFWEYLCDNWSTEWVHFVPLNSNVEAFLINFLITLVGRQWRNRKGTYAKLPYIITEKNVHKSSMTKYWRGHNLLCPSKQIIVVLPGFGAYAAEGHNVKLLQQQH